MTQTAILEPEQKVFVDNEIAPLIKQASDLVVRSESDKASAKQFIERVESLEVAIEAKFHPTRNREAALRQWQQLKETENAFYGVTTKAKEIAKVNIKAFERDVAIKAQRAAQEAEAKRQEEERKEREKLEAQAKKAEEKGKAEKAAVLREQAESVTVRPTFTPPPAAVKKLIWKAKVTNLFMLCGAIARGEVPFNVVEINQSALNDWAKGHDGKTKFAGIEFWQDISR